MLFSLIYSDVRADSKSVISSKLSELTGNYIKEKLKNAKLNSNKEIQIIFIVFKKERVLEVWGRDSPNSKMVILDKFNVCSMDFTPGTKLTKGDGKTPEGFYYLTDGYSSNNWFMWIDLNEPEKPGETGKGYVFKLCLNYPNGVDKKTTEKAGFSNPGSAICIHGNCVSIGCVSLKNEDYIKVFSYYLLHNSKKYGKAAIYIFPFRFSEDEPIEVLVKDVEHRGNLKDEQIIDLWKNLKEGYDIFLKTAAPLNFTINKDGRYQFSKK